MNDGTQEITTETPAYYVGDTPIFSATKSERLALSLRPNAGTPVRFKRQRSVLVPADQTEGVGVFLRAWNYDGINATIDIGAEKKLTLFLGGGDEMELLDDPRLLNLPMMHGDGI